MQASALRLVHSIEPGTVYLCVLGCDFCVVVIWRSDHFKRATIKQTKSCTPPVTLGIERLPAGSHVTIDCSSFARRPVHGPLLVFCQIDERPCSAPRCRGPFGSTRFRCTFWPNGPATMPSFRGRSSSARRTATNGNCAGLLSTRYVYTRVFDVR